jgi:molybdate transport system regulatory protein
MGSNSAGPVARLRIVLGGDIALGPGKADLMEGIRDSGSIAAAGRRMGMSYKQAWLLIETMNACFAKPLVAAVKGGKRGGGARLTPLGEDVLRRFRRMQASSSRAIAKDGRLEARDEKGAALGLRLTASPSRGARRCSPRARTSTNPCRSPRI